MRPDGRSCQPADLQTTMTGSGRRAKHLHDQLRHTVARRPVSLSPMLCLYVPPNDPNDSRRSLSSVRSESLIQRGSLRYVGPCQLFVNCNPRRKVFAGLRVQFGSISPQAGLLERFYLEPEVFQIPTLHSAAILP